MSNWKEMMLKKFGTQREPQKEVTIIEGAEKIKVTRADIVVRGTAEKPYYVIVYHKVGEDYDNEGFGSYCLNNVFDWKEQYLEVVKAMRIPEDVKKRSL